MYVISLTDNFVLEVPTVSFLTQGAIFGTRLDSFSSLEKVHRSYDALIFIKNIKFDSRRAMSFLTEVQSV